MPEKGGGLHQSLASRGPHRTRHRAFLEAAVSKASPTTFEDLHGLKQLPGIASQRLMAAGYGFGAEGDWKHAALVRALKVMGAGLKGGCSFMEDYTYHLNPGDEGARRPYARDLPDHRRRASRRAKSIPLGIGGKADPVRLVFDVPPVRRST